ncbi:MAG: methyltransferase [Myxococcota bacterium]
MDVFDAVMRDHRNALCREAIAAADMLGVLGALTSKPATSDELAQLLGLGADRLRALLDVLALEGVVAQRDGQWSAASVPGAAPKQPGWGRLVQALKDDRPVPGGDGSFSADGLERYHMHLVQAGAVAAREVAARFEGVQGTLLDLGGGAGCYTEAWLAADPSRRAALYDRPDVVALARSRLEEAYGGRLTYVEGDLLGEAALDGVPPCEVVLLANVLHLYGSDTCAMLVAQAAQTVRPGGWVCVKDLWMEPDRSGPPGSLYFALSMALYTEQGDVYTADVVQAWLGQAHLEHIEVARLKTGGLMVTGRRPQARR